MQGIIFIGSLEKNSLEKICVFETIIYLLIKFSAQENRRIIKIERTYARLMRSRIHVEHIPRLFGVKKYLNNYFARYKRLTRSRIYVELASPAYLGLRSI